MDLSEAYMGSSNALTDGFNAPRVKSIAATLAYCRLTYCRMELEEITSSNMVVKEVDSASESLEGFGKSLGASNESYTQGREDTSVGCIDYLGMELNLRGDSLEVIKMGKKGEGVSKVSQRDIPTQTTRISPPNCSSNTPEVAALGEGGFDTSNTCEGDLNPWVITTQAIKVSPLNLELIHNVKKNPCDEMELERRKTQTHMRYILSNEHNKSIEVMISQKLTLGQGVGLYLGSTPKTNALKQTAPSGEHLDWRRPNGGAGLRPCVLRDDMLYGSNKVFKPHHFTPYSPHHMLMKLMTSLTRLGSTNESAGLKVNMLREDLMSDSIMEFKPHYFTPHFQYYMLTRLMDSLAHLGATAYIYELSINYGVEVLGNILGADQVHKQGGEHEHQARIRAVRRVYGKGGIKAGGFEIVMSGGLTVADVLKGQELRSTSSQEREYVVKLIEPTLWLKTNIWDNSK